MSLKGDRRDHRAGEVALAVVEQLARHEQAILRIEGGFGIDLFECGDGRRRDRFARFAEGKIIADRRARIRSEEHTSELQSLMRISYAVFCLKKKNTNQHQKHVRSTST